MAAGQVNEGLAAAETVGEEHACREIAASLFD